MDEIVKAALKKWPNVPHCYGWLALDARGDWYMRDDRIQARRAVPAGQGQPHRARRSCASSSTATTTATTPAAGSSRTGRSASTSSSRRRPGSGGCDAGGDAAQLSQPHRRSRRAFESAGSTSTAGCSSPPTSASASCTRSTWTLAARAVERGAWTPQETALRRAAAALRLPAQSAVDEAPTLHCVRCPPRHPLQRTGKAGSAQDLGWRGSMRRGGRVARWPTETASQLLAAEAAAAGAFGSASFAPLRLAMKTTARAISKSVKSPPPCGPMLPLPLSAEASSASKPVLMRGAQAASSPSFGAPAAPAAWQAAHCADRPARRRPRRPDRRRP